MSEYDTVAMPSELVSPWKNTKISRKRQLRALAVYAMYRGLSSRRADLSCQTLEVLGSMCAVSPSTLQRYHKVLEEKKLVAVEERPRGVSVRLFEFRREKFFTFPVLSVCSRLTLDQLGLLLLLHWLSTVRGSAAVNPGLGSLSEWSGMSQRSVSKTLKNLEKLGHIKISDRGLNQRQMLKVLNTQDILLGQKRQVRSVKNDRCDQSKTTHKGKIITGKIGREELYPYGYNKGACKTARDLPEVTRRLRVDNEEVEFDLMRAYERRHKVEINEREKEVKENVKKGDPRQWGVTEFLTLFRMRFEWAYQTAWTGMTSAKDRANMKRLVQWYKKEESKEEWENRLVVLRDRINFLFDNWDKIRSALKLKAGPPNVSILYSFGDNLAHFMKHGFPKYSPKKQVSPEKEEVDLKKYLTGSEDGDKLEYGSDEMRKFLEG